MQAMIITEYSLTAAINLGERVMQEYLGDNERIGDLHQLIADHIEAVRMNISLRKHLDEAEARIKELETK